MDLSLSSEMPETHSTPAIPAGWVFYDARCRLCTHVIRRFAGPLIRRGFRLAPLQRGWVQERLGLEPRELRELRVLDAGGRVLGGAHAIGYLAARIWWARPLAILARAPAGAALLAWAYRRIADHRYCLSAACAPLQREPAVVRPALVRHLGRAALALVWLYEGWWSASWAPP